MAVNAFLVGILTIWLVLTLASPATPCKGLMIVSILASRVI
jgi:hypothetical protein